MKKVANSVIAPTPGRGSRANSTGPMAGFDSSRSYSSVRPEQRPFKPIAVGSNPTRTISRRWKFDKHRQRCGKLDFRRT